MAKLPSGWLFIPRVIRKGTSIEVEQKELVTCKDCKHWYSDADCGMACEFTNMSQPDDGFCNWAERKEE